MIDLGRPFRAAYAPARAYLLHRGLLGLLAFDTWLEMVEHAGRYGIGGFNVAHFAFLDSLLPNVSPALYAGLVLSAGLLALLMALGHASRLGKALVALTYTAAWLISLHDSYQHHYLLSWLLTWLVFVPDVRLAELDDRDRRLHGPGLPLTAFTCAIVYTFTAISKSEPEWRSGAVLRRLSHSHAPGDADPGVLDPLRDALMALGLDLDQAWFAIAGSVIALQVVAAIGYLASIGRDEPPGPVRTLLTSFAWFGIVSFHAFAELGDMFEIGWFSFYMLWIGSVLLAPARLVEVVARELTWPVGALARRIPFERLAAHRGVALVSLALASLALAASGAFLDLPGARAAGTFAALFSGLCGALCVVRARRADAFRLGGAGLVTALAFWLAMTQSDVRFDYYRRTAGELERMGLLRESLAAYKQAQRYAPSGTSRRGKIRKLERELRRESTEDPAP